MKRAKAASKRVATLKLKFAKAIPTHLRLVEAASRSKANANNSQTDLQIPQVRLDKVEQKSMQARKELDKTRDVFAGSAKTTEKV